MKLNELVQDLSNDLTTAQIASKHNVNIKFVQRRIREVKKRALCDTVWGLVAKHLRKKIIE